MTIKQCRIFIAYKGEEADSVILVARSINTFYGPFFSDMGSLEWLSTKSHGRNNKININNIN